MVRLIFTMVFIHINLVVCLGQIKTSENKIIFNAFFNKDSVFMGAPLKITISFKNNSEDTLKLYSEERVVIFHYSTKFITREPIDRMGFILREFSNRNSIVWLKPKEEIKYAFAIEAKENFFYEGENTVKVYYRNIWDDPVEHKKHKRNALDKITMLYSPPIKIIVNNKK